MEGRSKDCFETGTCHPGRIYLQIIEALPVPTFLCHSNLVITKLGGYQQAMTRPFSR